jgi:hypothetical protein
MISLQYKIKTGRKLDLQHPKRFTEKLQFYKLYYRNPEMIRCVDKADVRAYVEEKGLREILIPCVGVFENEKDIDWERLPNKFVIKDTLGMGGASVVIVKDKKTIDLYSLKKQVHGWLSANAHIKSGGREWPYYSGKNHRVIIEEYIESDPDKGGLIDYKIFCFNGEPKYLYVITDRNVGEKACLGIYDADFNMLEAYRRDEKRPDRKVDKPKEFDEMIEIAKNLSSGFPEARIDLYNVEGRILFGEITYWDGSGYMTFEPDEFDLQMGEAFNLASIK